jgi:hypothetical protein
MRGKYQPFNYQSVYPHAYHDLPTAVPHWARPRSRNVQHRVLLGDAWSPSELRQAPGVGQGLYIVTTWYVVETIADMINIKI